MSPDILLVEDDDRQRSLLGEILSDEGYFVEEAADGLEALERLGQMALPKLILLDLMMPRMSGWELRQRLLLNHLLAPVPVVILTGNANAIKGHERLRVQGWLLKPVKHEHLLGLVRYYCDGSSPTGTDPPPPRRSQQMYAMDNYRRSGELAKL